VDVSKSRTEGETQAPPFHAKSSKAPKSDNGLNTETTAKRHSKSETSQNRSEEAKCAKKPVLQAHHHAYIHLENLDAERKGSYSITLGC
jgi:hypothetical protein